jgi:BirA family biotin operon repressor/biotin-[acetyl-CoA-carboxylase] ligase
LGYKLNPGFDVLSKLSIEKELAKTGVQVFCYKDIESTNRKAKELSVQGVETPFVVVAATQNAGRGRLGRVFESPEGGVYFSLVLSGKDIVNPDLVTTSASLAVSRAMERLTGIKTDIKWVNDLYFNGKKVCGILCESFTANGKRFSVIGVGINLSTENFPDEIKNVAASLGVDHLKKEELGRRIAENILWLSENIGDYAAVATALL